MQAAAEASLSLHGRELSAKHANGRSNNEKECTDAGANERELCIAGPSRFTKREDLQALCQQSGTIKDHWIKLCVASRRV